MSYNRVIDTIRIWIKFLPSAFKAWAEIESRTDIQGDKDKKKQEDRAEG